MLRVAEKLLVVLLTLLILLSHVQGATAGMTPPSDQNDGLHQLAYNADGDWLMSAAAPALQSCEQLWPETGCKGLSCPFGHCFSCTPALHTPFAFPPAVLTTAPAWLQSSSSRVNQASSSLFRPPKS